MIEILRHPDLYSFAGNSMRFKVQGSNAVSKGSSFGAYIRLSLLHDLSRNESFSLIVNGSVFVFQALYSQNSKDNANTIYLTSKEGIATYVDVYNTLLDHPFFSLHFSITANDGRIILRAKTKDIYEFSIDVYSANPAISMTQDFKGGLGSLSPGYQIRRQILLPSESNAIISDEAIGVDGDGCLDADFSEYFHDKFKLDLNYPSSEVVHLNENWLIPYKARFWESADNFLGKIYESDEFYALPGRLPNLDYSKWINTGNSNIMNKLGLRFLTNFSGEKFVYPNSVEKLSFFLNQAGDYILRATLYYSDGFSKNIDLATVCSDNNRSLFEFDVSPSRILSMSPDPAILVNYSLALTTSTAYFSETRRYKLTVHNAFAKHFFFVNCFGVLESAVFTGTTKVESKYTRKNIHGIGANMILPASADGEVEYSLGTGWLSEDNWHWIDEFQQSLQIYEILQGELRRCVLTSEKSEYSQDKALRSHTISYIHSTDIIGIIEPRIFDNTFDNSFE